MWSVYTTPLTPLTPRHARDILTRDTAHCSRDTARGAPYAATCRHQVDGTPFIFHVLYTACIMSDGLCSGYIASRNYVLKNFPRLHDYFTATWRYSYTELFSSLFGDSLFSSTYYFYG